MNDTNNIQNNVLKRIEEGSIKMKSRRYFAMRTALLVGLGLVLVFGIQYILSFILFFLRESGLAYALVFGVRGWVELWNAFPLMLLIFGIALFVILQWLIQKYSSAYQYAFGVSLVILLSATMLGGYIIDIGAVHDRIFVEARKGNVPEPVAMMYVGTGASNTRKVLRGEVVSAGDKEWNIKTKDGVKTIRITLETTLPFGSDFESGDIVVVIAEESRPGYIEAFGIREIARELLDSGN